LIDVTGLASTEVTATHAAAIAQVISIETGAAVSNIVLSDVRAGASIGSVPTTVLQFAISMNAADAPEIESSMNDIKTNSAKWASEFQTAGFTFTSPSAAAVDLDGSATPMSSMSAAFTAFGSSPTPTPGPGPVPTPGGVSVVRVGDNKVATALTYAAVGVFGAFGLAVIGMQLASLVRNQQRYARV
jgi:hypothetical protein